MARVTAWISLIGAWPMLVATMLLRAWRTELTSWHTVKEGVGRGDAADDAAAVAVALPVPLEDPPPELQAARTKVAAAATAASALFVNTARLMSNQYVGSSRRALHPGGMNHGGDEWWRYRRRNRP
jgi:hypothetical protein